MLKANYEEIVNLISERSGLPVAEIHGKVDAKLKALSDLISREGAAHIVANELGLKLFDTSKRLQIKNILAGMRNVEALGKVTRLFPLRTFQKEDRSGKVASLFIGDETGQIRVTMWGEQAENINRIKEGDVVKISSAYVKESNGFRELHLSERGTLKINPEGETVSDVAARLSERPIATRKLIKDIKADDENIELFGTIVQVFEPRFFEICPTCGKRARPREDKFVCEAHGEVAPKYSYVFNAFLDDGTENIRTVFFKNQAENLFKMDEGKILSAKDNPSVMEDLKTSVLGNQIKVVGRVKKNDMFDRLEFNAQLVFADVDPEEESKRLDSAADSSARLS